MRFQKLMLWTLSATVGLTARPLLAQEDGAYLYKVYCAICHEATDSEARAPGQAVLRQMTPEHILQVLESGVMKTQAAERSRPSAAFWRSICRKRNLEACRRTSCHV